MILVDYSAISIGAIVSGRVGLDEKLLRHVILNNIRAHNLKHRAKYGELVLCMDRSSWRKGVFEPYKYRRKKARDEDKTDWNKDVWPILNKITDEIREFMPYRCIAVDGAEGDDVIATLTKWSQEFGQWEPTMIIASDKDYVQLHKYEGVKQWSTITKKLVKENPHDWLVENIARGQAKDGVPNIKTDADFFLTEGGRQTSISKKFLAEIADKGPEKALSDPELKRWNQNKQLMDFDCIPDEISKAVLKEYEDYQVPPFSGVMGYLIASRCGNLVDTLSDFKPGKI